MRPPLIVGIGGTMAGGSATERVLRAALDAAAALGAGTRLLAGPDLDLPMYAPEWAGRHPRARALVEALAEADGVIVASPAYHGTVSGLVKNALDHAEDLRGAERPYLEGRAIGCIAVAGGAQAGATTLGALRSVAHALRGWPTPLGVAVDTSDPVFDASGAVGDAVILGRLDLLADQVVGFARAAAPAELQALAVGARANVNGGWVGSGVSRPFRHRPAQFRCTFGQVGKVDPPIACKLAPLRESAPGLAGAGGTLTTPPSRS